MENMIYLKDVVSLNLNEEKCIGCGMCIEVCPHAVISMNGAGCTWIQKKDTCMECGACSRNCPTEAVSVQSDVGCAAAIINAMLGKSDTPCCGPIDSCKKTENQGNTACC